MYANLRVQLAERPVKRNRHGRVKWDETLFVWGVESNGDVGAIDGLLVTVKLDAQDGTGKYYEPAGERVVDLARTAMSIEADF